MKLIVVIEYDEDEMMKKDFTSCLDSALNIVRRVPDTKDDVEDNFNVTWSYFSPYDASDEDRW